MSTSTQRETQLLTLGVDLGGTKVGSALVDAGGSVLASHQRPTDPGRGLDSLLADIVDCVKQCWRGSPGAVKALGVGVAGQVDEQNGHVRFAPNLAWRDVPLRARLEQALGLPVVVTNDVRAATRGEWEYGAGRGVNDLVALFVGTGVGGGIVSSGQILKGCTGSAGELGHVTLVAEGRPCRCRNRGCLEAYVGGWAIAERVQEAVRADPQAGRTLVTMATNVYGIEASTLSRAFQQGDRLAARLVEETGRYLGAGVVGIVNAFNPCLLILGGGVVAGLPELVSIVDREVRASALEAAVDGLRIVTASLGDKAGVIGAAAMARDAWTGGLL